MKPTLAIAAALALAVGLAGCGTTAGGTAPVDQTAASGGRVYEAATLETLLKETEKTLGTGTIEGDAALHKTVADTAANSPIDAITAAGAVISPTTCSAALAKSTKVSSTLFTNNRGFVGAELKYKRGAVILMTVKGKPLPSSIYATAKSRSEASVAACTPMSLTIGGQTVPVKITKLTAPTDADQTTGYLEEITIPGTTLTVVAIEATYGNLLITAESVGSTAEAVAAIDAVVAAARADAI